METTRSIIDSLKYSKYFTQKKKKKKLIALQNKDLALSQKVVQGFCKLWPKKHLNKHFICNKNIPWAMLYIMTHQPQVHKITNPTPNWVTMANPNHITIKTPNSRFIPKVWDPNHQ